MSVPPTSGSGGSASPNLPTPTAADGKRSHQTRVSDVTLPLAISLLPTPAAGNPNDGERLASWEARRQRNLVKGYNGNGQGTPLGIAVQMIPEPRGLLPTPAARDGKGRDLDRQGGAGLPSMVMDGIRLLPTEKTDTHSTGLTLTDALVRGHGASSVPPSTDGPGSSVDAPQLQLWTEN